MMLRQCYRKYENHLINLCKFQEILIIANSRFCLLPASLKELVIPTKERKQIIFYKWGNSLWSRYHICTHWIKYLSILLFLSNPDKFLHMIAKAGFIINSLNQRAVKNSHSFRQHITNRESVPIKPKTFSLTGKFMTSMVSHTLRFSENEYDHHWITLCHLTESFAGKTYLAKKKVLFTQIYQITLIFCHKIKLCIVDGHTVAWFA